MAIKLDDATLVKFVAAKLERYNREIAQARTAEFGWEVPPDSDVAWFVEALRDLSERLRGDKC